ncbi:hypothetical protein, partial [Candidatus Pseudothioglobus singularis]|uniref:hypothetical protein n=1 Tax=Candidatus Pseudothioglobus singularis TaxID=1427364 RepID=UPI001BFFD5F9
LKFSSSPLERGQQIAINRSFICISQFEALQALNRRFLSLSDRYLVLPFFSGRERIYRVGFSVRPSSLIP